jgi:hypothetical protein
MVGISDFMGNYSYQYITGSYSGTLSPAFVGAIRVLRVLQTVVRSNLYGVRSKVLLV